MLLTDLLKGNAPISCALNPEITGITSDSRKVQEGFAFVALPGSKADGSQFIESAIKAGAKAVISETNAPVPHTIPHVVTANPRLLLSQMAARFYQPQPATIAAFTGTNGKTSTAHFCRALWQQLGFKSASIGTIGVIDEANSFAKENSASLTTPDPVTLHRILQTLAHKGIAHVAMEASSHGLDQYRLDGVEVKAAAFTNLSRDHLDYHLTYENYLAAKMHLFTRVMQRGGYAVLNADIPEYEALAQACRAREHTLISYGKKGEDLQLLAANPLIAGQEIHIRTKKTTYSLTIPLVGEFQAMNLLTALGLVIACGAKEEEAIPLLATLPSVPGRMEKVPTLIPHTAIFVDYAHTPDALEKALLALRPHTEGRLLVIFGCGGDRDKGKRPQMGKIAANLADIIIITDDNPRTEDPATIRKEVLAGCPTAIEIGDRGEAILYAVKQMKPKDILLIAGKGHEKTQIMKDASIPFDDVDVARAAAREGL